MIQYVGGVRYDTDEDTLIAKRRDDVPCEFYIRRELSDFLPYCRITCKGVDQILTMSWKEWGASLNSPFVEVVAREPY